MLWDENHAKNRVDPASNIKPVIVTAEQGSQYRLH
jgi:hypothetical protein